MEYSDVKLFGFSLLGVLLHNLIKIQAINRKSKGDFKAREFFRLEWPTIGISLGVSVVALLAKHEITQLKYVSGWLGLGFTAIGYMSQSILYTVMSRAEKILKKEKESE